MSKKILTIGFQLASDDTEDATLRSKMSLLDWDIVLFKPQINDFYSGSGNFFHGKPSLSDSMSFSLKECCEHWRREIKQAFETGKTVIVYLPAMQEVYVDSGRRTYSGTGRNQTTTRHVDLYSNYHAIPTELEVVPTSGSSIKLADRGAEILAPYWKEFEAISKYEVLLTGEKLAPCLITRTGNKVVGALFRDMTSSGTLLLLPDIDFEPEEFLAEKNDEFMWTKAARQFAGRFVSSIVSLDKALRSALEVTPEPAWASENRFVLASEAKLRAELLEAEKEVDEAQQRKESISDALREAGALRALLFEKGKPLEAAIISALRALGFKAEPFKESDSEFDVVFECDEGRLIGEAEGKDSKAVNIDKLRQLAMNIHEDLQREEVTVPAKPVLFGNGYRLQALQERPDPFTEKCHSAASTSSTALVFTPDLFPPVQYLASTTDDAYARACRQAILSSTGRVIFPLAPARDDASVADTVEIGQDI
ncbi:hypothetical protein [Paraburkholderia phenoliruptrix]|uniref:hypothetical protein n=1 Tax=Paraburkholderia phenoliruptrix TaxID=252970 RepID=UPI001C5016F8|nr:hypothetical protein [Paraburkholderia phenoliruptrix]MBW0449262.1 hypothetical protein [Paraburkholderia phenoliruptrix]MBW9097542.1 hypothetical protein [Paraburkholderia phenoliruptrix]